MQIEQEGARIRLHRARDVEDEHDLAQRMRAAAVGADHRVAARRERGPDEGTHVERASTAVAPKAVRAAPWPADGDLRDQRAGPRELVRRHRSEVARPQQLVAAVRAGFDLAAVELGPGARRPDLSALGGLRRGFGRTQLGAGDRPEEPRVEGAVERVEVLAPGHERLAKGPVHVFLAAEVDRVEPAERVGNAPWPDLEAALAEH